MGGRGVQHFPFVSNKVFPQIFFSGAPPLVMAFFAGRDQDEVLQKQALKAGDVGWDFFTDNIRTSIIFAHAEKAACLFFDILRYIKGIFYSELNCLYKNKQPKNRFSVDSPFSDETLTKKH